ncbi:acyl carrier protein [Desmonostoc muscorum CCALA 125]|uniref:Acyl carrier protein n=1 Tax=Desmonostoc muscorum LEGE 12446 TaxID=1828758 RepID=A0A8J7CZ44_DESMC|nr:acyl carrier protein [Desmonostoc muscorum]MBX9258491.1 acyl carrier protein [Desmonostoc muscorum CCALA 125]MCF2144950.1 acyl carrier protein [Desmonostoc muscorum LEGE 12446]
MENSRVQDSTISLVPAIKTTPTTAEIKGWIVSYLTNLLEVEADDIDVTIPFDRYGLDSAIALGMIGELEEWLGYELDPTLLYDYPTIEALVKHLSLNVQHN